MNLLKNITGNVLTKGDKNMSFSWDDLFTQQRLLNNHILNNHDLTYQEIEEDHFLALIVEIGEFANETKCFKYWKSKKDVEQKLVLEELIDCMHFMLSIGLATNMTHAIEEKKIKQNMKGSITDLIHGWIEQTYEFKYIRRPAGYLYMWDHFFSLANKLGFNSFDLYQEYLRKNDINHRRQAEGY